MKTLLPLTVLLAAAITSACAQEKPTSSRPATPTAPERCRHFAEVQFRNSGVASVSGTSYTSTYNATTGFCTVEISNKTSSGNFSSRISTNTFDDPSATNLHFSSESSQTYLQPAAIKWQQPPQRLLCSKVTTTADGKQLCTPYKPDPNAIPLPEDLF